MAFAQFQFRRDTAANWTTADPILAEGEIGLELDTDQFKIGDGTSQWSALAYGGIQGPQGADGVGGDSAYQIAVANGFVGTEQQWLNSFTDRANHTGTQAASTISDFDTEVSNNTDVAANTSARHDAVTVVDSSEIDFTLTGQQITASIVAGSIDESKLDASVNASLNKADAGREVFTANRTYYVRTDGNNSNDGLTNTSGGAFLTIQKAIDVIASLDISLYAATIKVADGTYSGFTLKDPIGGGKNTCFIVGNNNDASAVVIAQTETGVTVGATNHWSISYLTFNGGVTNVSLVGGILTCSDCNFIGNKTTAISCLSGSALFLSGAITIDDAHANNAIIMQINSLISISNATFTIGANASITSGAFISGRTGSMCSIRTTTFTGTMTGGQKYNCNLNASIDTAGAGTSLLPGEFDGILNNGGQYV